MTTLLLGPTSWARDHTPASESLPPPGPRTSSSPTEESIPSPIEIRRRLVRDLEPAGAHIAIMEDLPEVGGERLTTKFHRILGEGSFEQVSIYWPAGANRSGLDVELGFLLSMLERRELRPESVLLEVQTRCAEFRENYIVFLEEGKRTQYFLDLFRVECPILLWSTYDELFENLLAGALAVSDAQQSESDGGAAKAMRTGFPIYSTWSGPRRYRDQSESEQALV